ncbi:MAG: thioredoxin-disulfide reductase, partial [Acidimicrobiales bacterium]
MPELRRVVIIGSGPAGLTTAIYTARADLSPLVVEGEPSSTSDQPGGQLMLTTDVENYPGFADGIMGPELMATMRAQASRFGSSFLTAKVTKIDLADRPFRIWLSNSHYGAEPAILAESVVVATGARSLLLGIEGERRLLGYGVSTCATCDGFFFRGKELAVVGGGDSALEEALFLTKFASKVSVIHRRKELRASKIMQDRAFRNPRIEIRWNTVVEGILGARSVEAVSLRDVVDDRRSTLAVGGVFVAIGHAPNTDLFKGHLDMDAAGYLDTHHGTLTSVPGVFAAGDVQDHVYRQAVTAAGSGCMAALDV